jgi:serralysin
MRASSYVVVLVATVACDAPPERAGAQVVIKQDEPAPLVIPCTQVSSQRLRMVEELLSKTKGGGFKLPGFDKQMTLSLVSGATWPTSTLRMSFVENIGSPKLRNWVAAAAKEWQHATGVEFRVLAEGDPSAANAEVRISFAGAGNMARIGTAAKEQAAGRPTVWLGGLSTHSSSDEVRRIALHELGHALGAPHEHQTPLAKIRWVRPVVLDYYKKTYGWGPDLVEANVFHQYGKTEVEQEELDLDSIMTYPIRPDWNEDRLTVGLKNAISPRDAAFIRKVYGSKPK